MTYYITRRGTRDAPLEGEALNRLGETFRVRPRADAKRPDLCEVDTYATDCAHLRDRISDGG